MVKTFRGRIPIGKDARTPEMRLPKLSGTAGGYRARANVSRRQSQERRMVVGNLICGCVREQKRVGRVFPLGEDARLVKRKR